MERRVAEIKEAISSGTVDESKAVGKLTAYNDYF